jgi:protein-disulfide isomerase
MSKRHVTQEQLRRENLRSLIMIIGVVAAGIVIFAFTILRTTNTFTPTVTADISITPITPKVIHISVDGLHIGSPNAPVKIDVWEDFQCPICKYYNDNIEPQLIKNYIETGKVYYTFHFLPIIEQNSTLPSHESHQAANAAMCANEQGRFWDYHDLLFANALGENVGSFTDTRLIAFARGLNLKMSDFNQCFQAKRFYAQIDQDYAAGLAKGAQGTPSIFLNGTLLTPGYLSQYNQISQAIDSALAVPK